jgi:hypothetical protein
LKEISEAEVSEFKIGTNDLTFVPHKLKGIKKEIDIGTAGSITLFLQGILKLTKPFKAYQGILHGLLQTTQVKQIQCKLGRVWKAEACFSQS